MTTIEHAAAAAGLAKPTADDPTGKLILEFSAALDQVARAHCPVWSCDNCQFNSDPKLGIIVGLSQIEEIRKRSAVSQFPNVLYWLMAHEMAHQVQFRTYGTELWSLPVDQRQVYEAQADILAGKFLLERLPLNATEADNRAITETLRVAYDLGTEQYSPADHPSHEARLTAVRLGMAAGMQAKLAAQADQQMRASAMVLAQKIDYRFGEDVLSWSLRVARRATNQKSPDILNLVLIKEDVFFDRDPTRPVVAYWLTYENRGTRMLNVDLEALCAAVPRDDPGDTLRWLRISSLNYQVPIPMGGRYTFKGAIEWYGDNAMYPRVVAAPMPQALIRAEAVGGTAPAAPGAPQADHGMNAGQAVAPPVSSVELMRNVLLDLLAAGRDGFRSLRAGPGQLISDFVRYGSRISFPGALRTEVRIPETGVDDEASVAANLARTRDESDAKAVYDRTVATVRQALPGEGWKQESHNGDAAFLRGNQRIAVRQWRIEATKTWRVDVTIE